MKICKQLLDGIPVRGSVNRRTGQANIYIITGWPQPKCTCTSFAINRNRAVSLRTDVASRHPNVIAFCKHLDTHYEELCHYTESKDGPPLIDNMCPHCSGPLAEVNVAGECTGCHTELVDANILIGLCDNCLLAKI